MEKLLDIKDLKIQFSAEGQLTRAVDGISFSIFGGETIGLVGESGSGKSLTALALMGLVPPPGKITEGAVWFYSPGQDAEDLLKISGQKMQKRRGKDLAMIFQEPMTSLNPVFPCGYQVAEVLLFHLNIGKKEAKAQVLDLFTKVRLPDPERIYRSFPHQLSGGQKQRVMIAMAMAAHPSLLIADEPTTALDVTVQKSILELIRTLKEEENMSVLFISHDLGVIAEIADRILVMFNGKIIEQGSVDDIFLRPQHPYTKGLLACRPPLHHRLRKLPVISDFMEIDPEGNTTETQRSLDTFTKTLIIPPEETISRMKEQQKQEPLLAVQQLHTSFPGRRGQPPVKAVDGVSFEVYPGETLGLVGESGCGKTTLARTLLRLIPAHAGSVWYQGKDLLQLPKEGLQHIRRDIQIIFQDPYSSLNPRMTVGEAIMEPMRVHQLENNEQSRKEKAIELLETVSLEARHFFRYPHEFSGGQRQRIGIARALALQPRFLICDESVSALDVSIQAQVLNLFLDLKEKKQLTYIFISHDLSVVRLMSDRIMVMTKGKIVETGPADEVFFHPRQPYTRQLIEAIPKGYLS